MINSPQNLLSTLRKNDLDILFCNGKREFHGKNAVIINEDDLSDSAYIIHSGKVKIFLSDKQGKEIVLSELSAGEYFGEMALIDQNKRSATVMAMEDTELTVISRQSFKECLHANPDISERIMLGLVTNLREANKKISGLVFMDTHGRVANMLLALAKDQEGLLVIDERPPQQHIANTVGASREMISRILRHMAADGHISIAGKRIVINRTALFSQ
jgi:CRP/FNR family cyclic AMP-dependent transcriptional regulator